MQLRRWRQGQVTGAQACTGTGGQSVGMAQREGFRNFPESSSGMAG